MKISEALRSLRGRNKISSRFRNINVAFFIAISIVIVVVMIAVFTNIADTVSKDYARLYSSNTVQSMDAYFGVEIALLKKTANSKGIMDWFADEDNQEKKIVAYDEMQAAIDTLSSSFLYFAIEKSLHEFTMEKDYTIDDVKSFAILEPDYYDDAWYFECVRSDKDYQLNVDIDKILKRKRVWLNYKVERDGEVLGALSTGLEFSLLVEELFSEYDNKKVRCLVIDENGIIHMDNALLGDDDFLHYTIEEETNIKNMFSDPDFLSASNAYMDSIHGYFNSDDKTIVIPLSTGQYRYATIAPIVATTWSVVTFYDPSSLYNITKLMPLFIVLLTMFILFFIATSFVSNKLILTPFRQLMNSIGRMRENKDECVYGVDRHDEFGSLAKTIQDMKNRLDSYNTDLEKEVAVRSSELKHAYDMVKEQHQTILSSIDYASKIQKNLLPRDNVFKEAFSDYSIIWSPRDIVGGDIYWAKNFDKGTILCVCDCTGHGTPGALLTMLVVSAFETIVHEKNYNDTAEVMWRLDQRLTSVLNVNPSPQTEKRKSSSDINDGCDLAVLFIAKDGTVTFSSGNTYVFICNGKEVDQVKGQKLFIGEGNIKSKEDVKVITISANPDNKFYIASDGLYDQNGGNLGKPFGYRIFKQLILENHNEKQTVISDKIWKEYESYRGENARRDDLELITFKI